MSSDRSTRWTVTGGIAGGTIGFVFGGPLLALTGLGIGAIAGAWKDEFRDRKMRAAEDT